MIGVVGDAELLLDNLGNALAGPDIASEAQSLRASCQQSGQLGLLLWREAGRSAGGGAFAQRLGSFFLGAGQPMADRTLSPSQGASDWLLLPAQEV